jgi:hypothetical protein
LDRDGIAARLRGLIGGQNEGELGDVARRLGVDEVSLRMSIDDVSPYPTVDVLAAVVLTYGVDPTWLVSGDYSPDAHRNVADGGRDLAADSIRLMIERRAPQAEEIRPPSIRLMRDA